MPVWLTQILYLVSAVLFIIGIKRLGSPGNRAERQPHLACGHGARDAGDAGSIKAIVSYWVILAGVAVGTRSGCGRPMRSR